MAVILASSCLLGCECRYKGDGCKCDALIKLAESNTIIGVCPEQMGGLPTPRDPAERQGDKVISCAGKDVTKEYTKGAETALYFAKLNHVDFAVMKAEKSVLRQGTHLRWHVYGQQDSRQRCNRGASERERHPGVYRGRIGSAAAVKQNILPQRIRPAALCGGLFA